MAIPVNEDIKYFCYERSVGNRWIPMFYTEKPWRGMEWRPERTQVWEVPTHWTFDMAMMKHPRPLNPEEEAEKDGKIQIF